MRLRIPGQKLLYATLVPLMLAATLALGYIAYRSNTRLERLSGAAILQDAYADAGRIRRNVERDIIAADNEAFDLAARLDPAAVRAALDEPPERGGLPRIVRSVLAMSEEDGETLAYGTRGPPDEPDFRKVFRQRILDDLDLENEPLHAHKHRHADYAGRTYLVAYEVRAIEGRRVFIVAETDVDWIVQHRFPAEFRPIEGKRLFNVVDTSGRLVFGRDLSAAGDLVVGLRFPTTLWAWRIQIAPKQAPQIEATAGRRRRLELVLMFLALGTVVVGSAFLVFAVRKEKRLRELESDFMANVSHELKTPLSLIRMYAELLLLRRGDATPRQKEYSEIILRESERLTTLIDNVLDFTKLERGRVPFEFQTGDLGSVVRSAVEAFRTRVDAEGATLRVDVAPDLPPVRIDEHAMTLALVNLLDNALKYGRGADIEVSCESKGGEVLLHVLDHGPGLVPEAKRRVFERFFRAQSSAGTRTRGSGIGLSLVKQIAEAHGGRAWVDSELGAGARFSVAIPALKTGRAPAALPEAPAA